MHITVHALSGDLLLEITDSGAELTVSDLQALLVEQYGNSGAGQLLLGSEVPGLLGQKLSVLEWRMYAK